MLFITAQSFVGIHLPFFDKAKHYRNYNAYKKSQSQQMAAGYLFFISGELIVTQPSRSDTMTSSWSGISFLYKAHFNC